MNQQERRAILVTLPSPLGWMALIGAGEVLRRLSFGHSSPERAVAGLEPELMRGATPGVWNEDLVCRLEAYASGEPVDFRDVRIDTTAMSEFRRRVLRHCRAIPYGQIATYGQLAAKAGSPKAARAVGSCMAANRFPLIVPCHRVLPADGHVGAFSAPGGVRTKRRLLAMEAAKETGKVLF